jgi:hypothetical protein
VCHGATTTSPSNPHQAHDSTRRGDERDREQKLKQIEQQEQKAVPTAVVAATETLLFCRSGRSPNRQGWSDLLDRRQTKKQIIQYSHPTPTPLKKERQAALARPPFFYVCLCVCWFVTCFVASKHTYAHTRTTAYLSSSTSNTILTVFPLSIIVLRSSVPI